MATKGGEWLWWVDHKNEECRLFYIFPEWKKGFGSDQFGIKEGL
jgi:hypothetical protein